MQLHGPEGSHDTNALLDLGSPVTLVMDDLCDKLGIPRSMDELLLNTLNGSERLQPPLVSFTVQSVKLTVTETHNT